MPARQTAPVDPRSPLVVDTRDLGRRAGEMRELQRQLAAPPEWSLELVRVPEGATLELDIRLESVVDGVLVSTVVRAPLSAECGRCLDPFSTEVELTATDLFVYEPEADDEEVRRLEGDLLDLGPLLRDAVVLALPLNPVCSPDCAGLCPTCGARLNDVEPGHGHEEIDPRWAALGSLREPADDQSGGPDNRTRTPDVEEH
jgi:uncharacterized protein